MSRKGVRDRGGRGRERAERSEGGWGGPPLFITDWNSVEEKRVMVGKAGGEKERERSREREVIHLDNTSTKTNKRKKEVGGRG